MNNQLTTLAKSATKLPVQFGNLEARRLAIARAMAKLKRSGLIYATEHWRNGQYLYLLHPSKVGEKRRREYVGADPKRIQLAQAAIQRAKEFDALARELRDVDGVAYDAAHLLTDLFNTLRRSA